MATIGRFRAVVSVRGCASAGSRAGSSGSSSTSPSSPGSATASSTMLKWLRSMIGRGRAEREFSTVHTGGDLSLPDSVRAVVETEPVPHGAGGSPTLHDVPPSPADAAERPWPVTGPRHRRAHPSPGRRPPRGGDGLRRRAVPGAQPGGLPGGGHRSSPRRPGTTCRRASTGCSSCRRWPWPSPGRWRCRRWRDDSRLKRVLLAGLAADTAGHGAVGGQRGHRARRRRVPDAPGGHGVARASASGSPSVRSAPTPAPSCPTGVTWRSPPSTCCWAWARRSPRSSSPCSPTSGSGGISPSSLPPGWPRCSSSPLVQPMAVPAAANAQGGKAESPDVVLALRRRPGHLRGGRDDVRELGDDPAHGPRGEADIGPGRPGGVLGGGHPRAPGHRPRGRPRAVHHDLRRAALGHGRRPGPRPAAPRVPVPASPCSPSPGWHVRGSSP